MKILILSLLLVSGIAFADYDDDYDDYPTEPPTIINNTTVINNTTLITSTHSRGIASAIAAGQCQFDWASDLQGCVAVGTYAGNDAISFQLGQRYETFLINGGVNYEAGKYSAGAAVNWKFK